MRGARVRSGLLGVGRDDFKVVARAERKKCVLCAAAGMDAAENGAHTGVLLDEGDAAIEIAAAEKNVIEQRRCALRCPRDGRRDGRSCGDGKESPSR